MPAARTAFERALAIREARLRPDAPLLAASLNNLGLVLRDLGDLPPARTALERALTIWEAQLGADHPHLAFGMSNLGLVLRDLGDLEGARAAEERALAIREAKLGPDHPHVVSNLSNLGFVLRDAGDLPAARAALERAVTLGEARTRSSAPGGDPCQSRSGPRRPRGIADWAPVTWWFQITSGGGTSPEGAEHRRHDGHADLHERIDRAAAGLGRVRIWSGASAALAP
jgi:tetratricopeptide (TPR) repeat protein